jgi:integrase/recombinase XerD
MTDECISPLRRRMIEGMTVRNFVVKTQTDYIRHVKSFAVFLGARATTSDPRRPAP